MGSENMQATKGGEEVEPHKSNPSLQPLVKEMLRDGIHPLTWERGGSHMVYKRGNGGLVFFLRERKKSDHRPMMEWLGGSWKNGRVRGGDRKPITFTSNKQDKHKNNTKTQYIYQEKKDKTAQTMIKKKINKGISIQTQNKMPFNIQPRQRNRDTITGGY